MKHKAPLTAALVAFLLTQEALFAGGVSFDARVVSLSNAKGDKATFVVEGRSEDIMPSCRTVHVTTDYLVWNLPWDGDPVVTRTTHREALELLKKSLASGAAVRFGLLGTGLHPESKPCAFQSRGLAVLKEEGGGEAVYSVYDAP